MISDGTIRKLMREKRIILDDIEDDQIQPASVDLCLDDEFRVFDNHHSALIDPLKITETNNTRVVVAGEYFILHPGEFVLGATVELVGVPDDIVGRVEGKSSMGRLGLLVHATAGFIDPGFQGKITLELSNVSRLPIKLTPGMRICQVSFLWLDKPCERPYGHPDLKSKYQNQTGVVASRYGATA